MSLPLKLKMPVLPAFIQINMEKLYASLELAKLAQVNGFVDPTTYAWIEQGGWNTYTTKQMGVTYVLRTDGNPFGMLFGGKNWNAKLDSKKNKIICSAPTLAQLVDWFRTKHNYHIATLYNGSSSYYWTIEEVKIWGKTYNSADIDDNEYDLAHHNDCLESAIKHAFKLVFAQVERIDNLDLEADKDGIIWS